jgi:hypothetical protein
MKLLCVILSFSVLLTGCYSHTTLTADSPQSKHEVSFRLKDGTFILSTTYERVEYGYKVVGKRVQQNPPAEIDFSGILLDTQIKEAVTNEFETGKTVVVLMLGVGLAAVAWYHLVRAESWGL